MESSSGRGSLGRSEDGPRTQLRCAVCGETLPEPAVDKHVRRDHLGSYRPFSCGLCLLEDCFTSFFVRDDARLHTQARHPQAARPSIVEDLDSAKEAAFHRILAQSVLSRSQAPPAPPHQPFFLPFTPQAFPAPPQPPPAAPPSQHHVPGHQPLPLLSNLSPQLSGTLKRPLGLTTPGSTAPKLNDSGYQSPATQSPAVASLRPSQCIFCPSDPSTHRSYVKRREHAKSHLAKLYPGLDSPDEAALSRAEETCFPQARRPPPPSPAQPKRKALVCRAPGCGKTSAFDHRIDHVVRHHWEQDALRCQACPFREKWSPGTIKNHCRVEHGDEALYDDLRPQLREELQAKVDECFQEADEPAADSTPQRHGGKTAFSASQSTGLAQSKAPAPTPAPKTPCVICQGEEISTKLLAKHIWEHLGKVGELRFVCGADCDFSSPSELIKAMHEKSSGHRVGDRREDLVSLFRHHAAQCFPNHHLTP